ncbi:histidine--tRNA ligase [Tenacibaculum aiptasiae]|uniref:Histidine--tRNA ligase n=1 Tax=Tenacibaculum aiptasiae TaxID=426481 RepID=A0A7J5AQG6_9FLAO|nr:histidine--tRNA ligase [Tenacibaculum aiptasiae]KAB1159859.1 histidine--tRNA ligase [Tenacibaculum aiptasiae]
MKPSIPKGTRDFSSSEVAKRNYIFNIIRHSFENFGFQPIETPSFEKSSTLMGKYGEEGDRLIFKILNSGNFLFEKNTIELPDSYEKIKHNSLDDLETSEKIELNKFTNRISTKALRYDLTVPFARYVVQHQNDITFPFKRYQIQPVWRADKPQKGRFREFYQCDADVVGSKSLVQEVEFVQLYDTVFSKLGLVGTTIKINNRKILSGIAEVIGASDKLIDFTVALDKLDKIGKEGVVKEMLEKGISEAAIEKVDPLFNFSGTNQDKLVSLEEMLKDSEEGIQGVNDLRTVVNMIEELGLTSATLELDVTLARGLNYYTGAIYEVAAPKGVKMGSIGGGGRYDDLTGIFGLKDVSGVGISFGLDRIYLVMEELNLFEAVELPKPKVLFMNFDESQSLSKIKAIKELRNNNIKSELYPDVAGSIKQQKKQWKYATNREIDFVVTDIENGTLVVKNMKAGEQFNCTVNELINKLQ